MKLTRPFTLLILIVCLLGMAAVFASTKFLRSSSSLPTSPSETVSMPQQQTLLNSAYFNAAGLSVQVAAVAAQNSGGQTSLNYTINNTGSFATDSIDMALFDFDPSGGLVKVQSWNVRTPLNAGASAPISFKLKYRAAANARLVLSIETIKRNDSTPGIIQVNLSDLARTIALTMAGNKGVPLPEVKTVNGALESFGAAYCSDAFSKAFRLSKTADNKRLTSFTCDRTERTYLYGFSGKNLLIQ